MFNNCIIGNEGGLLKPGIGWDWPGSAGTRSRVLAFGTIGSRVPDFDVIAISDSICFLPLAINNSDAMVIASRPFPADTGSRIPGLVAPVISIPWCHYWTWIFFALHSIHRWWRHYVIITSILDRRITPYLGDLCFRKYSSSRIDEYEKLPLIYSLRV